MKGAVAAMLAVVRAVAETDTTPAVPLGFVFSSDEETSGGETLRDGLDTFPSSPSACLIGEMTGTSARPSVAVADKGSIWLTLAATGEGAHGSRPMLGVNATTGCTTPLTASDRSSRPSSSTCTPPSNGYSPSRSPTTRRLWARMRPGPCSSTPP
ncbi:M20/M25/M40 family metallo-hydrolase [Haloarcula sp. Atlit-7R]|uniref:M20/M25/M40 family metallo-hydrolase n=1 Tax=Haloarcula sp. Atlit-7R TaxID=2282125 RepID=UPI0018F7AE84